jgi:DNA-binding Lrp family transcriptional regulator
MTAPLDDIDRSLIEATQAGLPLCERPFAAVAEIASISEAEVIRRFGRMVENGIVRRIGAVPNHYALGYRANGMSVWDVPDDRVAALGRRVGALDFVSHCYHRPRHLPLWPYNLFAMVHGPSRDEIAHKVSEIAAILGDDCRAHDVLFSTRILKKTGLRLAG